MRLLAKTAVGAAFGTAVLAACAGSAAADIACRGSVCWHTSERYEYPPEARVIIHPEGWRWGSHEHYTWREHEGRGYWQGRSWREW
jgi:hypothetical protein